MTRLRRGNSQEHGNFKKKCFGRLNFCTSAEKVLKGFIDLVYAHNLQTVGLGNGLILRPCGVTLD